MDKKVGLIFSKHNSVLVFLMGQNPKCPGYNWGKNQGYKFKYIFDVYSFHHHRRCWPTFIQYLSMMYFVKRMYDPPTKFRFSVGPASQPIAGSMPVNRLRRWPNTNPSPGLLYTLRKHVAFTQCCFNVDPHSSTLARHWNSIGWFYRVFWLRETLFISAPETPDNTKHWPIADVMLVDRLWRWANIMLTKTL